MPIAPIGIYFVRKGLSSAICLWFEFRLKIVRIRVGVNLIFAFAAIVIVARATGHILQ